MVKEQDGETSMVKYKDGEKKMIVTPQTRHCRRRAPRKKDEIKPGAQIIIFGWEKQPDGSVLAKACISAAM